MLRVWLAGKLVALASRIVAGAHVEEPEEVEEEDDEAGLPAGQPVVVLSTEARRMLYEGEAIAQARASKPEAEPPAPARGSLRDRIERARKNAP